ncbi:hypothetical protein HYV21_02245 [Candidatus Microgenomates bacterium]|nr:hypothetical protein [Candidatus Microgenomates bacterium]
MREKNGNGTKNREEITSTFSGVIRVEDKTNGLVFEGVVNLISDGRLDGVLLKEIEQEQQVLLALFRVDQSTEGFVPSAILTTHDGRRVLHELRRKVNKQGEEYYALSGFPYDLERLRVGKSDFRVTLNNPTVMF